MNKGLFNKCLLDDRLLICRFELKLYWRFPLFQCFLVFCSVLAQNFWCGNFVERHSFRRVSGESPETLQKLHGLFYCPFWFLNVIERYSHGVAIAEVRWTCRRNIFGTKNVKCCTDIWTGKTNNFFN